MIECRAGDPKTSTTTHSTSSKLMVRSSFDDWPSTITSGSPTTTEQTGDKRQRTTTPRNSSNCMMFLYFVQRKRRLGDGPGFAKGFERLPSSTDRGIVLRGLLCPSSSPSTVSFPRWVLGISPAVAARDGSVPLHLAALRRTSRLTKAALGFSDDRFESVLELLEHYNLTISETRRRRTRGRSDRDDRKGLRAS